MAQLKHVFPTILVIVMVTLYSLQFTSNSLGDAPRFTSQLNTVKEALFRSRDDPLVAPHTIDSVSYTARNKHSKANNIVINQDDIRLSKHVADITRKNTDINKDDAHKDDTKKSDNSKYNINKDDSKNDVTNKDEIDTNDIGNDLINKTEINKNDTDKDNTDKDATEKDDTNTDEKNKGDSEKDATNKDQTNKDGTNTDNTNTDNNKNDDTNKDDITKDNINKHDIVKEAININEINKDDTDKADKDDTDKDAINKEETNIDGTNKDDHIEDGSNKGDNTKDGTNTNEINKGNIQIVTNSNVVVSKGYFNREDINNNSGLVSSRARLFTQPLPSRAVILPSNTIKPINASTNDSLDKLPTTSQPPIYKFSYTFDWTQPPPITLHSEFTINQRDLCPPRMDFIIMVHTSTSHFGRREAIRGTFGNLTTFKNLIHRVVFLVGTPAVKVMANKLRDEAAKYRDIVQGPFVDSYRNLTHKAVMGLRWVAEHCPQARFVVRIDDDVFINVDKLVNLIFPSLEKRNRTIACKIVYGGNIFRGRRKWAVSKGHFKGLRNYPFNMCNGYFAVMTSDLIPLMVKAAEVVPFMWIDDVYVYGMLADAIGGVDHIQNYEWSKDFEWAQACFKDKGFKCKVAVVTGSSNKLRVSQVYTMWDSIRSHSSTITDDQGLILV